MKKSTRTVGPKGQVVIPKEVRDETGLTEGSEVSVEARNGDVVIRRVAPLTGSYVDYFTATYARKVEKPADFKRIIEEEHDGRINLR
jgi:AbrB family looped-hinge helix DNA binding protein